MGHVYADLKLENARNIAGIAPIVVNNALADTGALYLCIPEHIQIQLELDELEKREVKTADGKKHLAPYVGPVKLSFENRSCYVGALVLGDDVLLGVVPMEDMDLVVNPSMGRITVNPQSPNIASGLAKSYSIGETKRGIT